MIGKVTTWQMTDEQLKAYIEKHPIKPTPKEKARRNKAFADIGNKTCPRKDWNWRGEKGAESRWGGSK